MTKGAVEMAGSAPSQRTHEQQPMAAPRDTGEHAATQAQLHAELEQRTLELESTRLRLAGAAGAERQQLIERYLELHEEIERYRWYLSVQRELGTPSE